MLSAPASGRTLIIYNDPPLTQGVDIVDNEILAAETQEQALDKAILMIQRLDHRVDRSVQLAEGFTATFDPKLPWDLDDAGDKVPLVSAAGTGWAAASTWPTATNINNAQTYANAAQAAQAAAEAAQAAAELAETHAETAETNAETAETNAAASAAAAAASATSVANCIPAITGTRAAPSSIVAGTGIAFTGTKWFNTWFIQGSGGAVDVSANPQIAAATSVGQQLRLIGRDDTNTVQLDDGTGLSLNGSWYAFADSVLGLVWDGTNWVEEYRK